MGNASVMARMAKCAARKDKLFVEAYAATRTNVAIPTAMVKETLAGVFAMAMGMVAMTRAMFAIISTQMGTPEATVSSIPVELAITMLTG